MRLDRLDLTRFGRFTDHALVLPPPAPGGADLHVVYGPNEAGKSTLFAAWLDLLYGIPTRSRYDFLHPGPTLQIGARLTHGEQTLELKRLKRNNASLLDRHDAPLPESVLQSVLGGLSRDGYGAMFSLDDDTLEKGGDSILASRGDLGEMLFSASAGLSELAPQLETIRAGLDGFHRTGKRSGWIYDAKKRLAELDKQRRALETSASALRNLARAAEATQAAWHAARNTEDAAIDDLDRLRQLAETLPITRKLARCEAALAPLAHLPDPPATASDDLARIERDRLALNTSIRARATRVQGLNDRLARSAPDAAVLAQTTAIHAAEQLRPEHDTAVKDLPRRRAEAEEIAVNLRALLSELGQSEQQAADLVVPAAQMATLQKLLEQRSGLIGAVAASRAETVKAETLLAREREMLGDPGPAEDEGALEAFLARQQSRDPSDAHRIALRDRNSARAGGDAALAALAPWTGDADTLAALAVPPAWQIETWQTNLETARQQEADALRAAADLTEDIARAMADDASRTKAQAATGVTLTDAATARSRREALWSGHRATLTLPSADAFEQALRADDHISALLAEALSEARRTALHQSALDMLKERSVRAENQIAAARGEYAAIEAQIAASLANLGLQGAALTDLKRWLDLRRVALAERTVLREAEETLTRAKAGLIAAAEALRTLLGDAPGSKSTPETYEPLLARARARLDAFAQRREARRRLTALAGDLRERQQTQGTATAALERWQSDWAGACRGTILARHPDDDPGAGAALQLLDRLGADWRKVDQLNDRIAKMAANRDRFAAAKSDILHSLGAETATPWADILTRLRKAEDAARDHQGLAQQIADEAQDQTQDARDLVTTEAELAALARILAWSEGGMSLADHFAACQQAAMLRRDIAALRQELQDRPTPDGGQDEEQLKQQIAARTAERTLLRNETETCLAAHLDAKRLLDDVGGDDALARIVAERENLLLDAREQARAHLAARFGLIAFETGLRRYRDLHRSAMLARASDAFSRLSCGAYAGLAAQPDGAQEVLVALPQEGGSKRAVDLSKGTRFQLYLALRMAGYHELAQSRPTVPFIADDIMETFDDARSTAAFALLAEMSRTGQVIYLTHHQHLCDIARAVCPEVNIVSLNTV